MFIVSTGFEEIISNLFKDWMDTAKDSRLSPPLQLCSSKKDGVSFASLTDIIIILVIKDRYRTIHSPP